MLRESIARIGAWPIMREISARCRGCAGAATCGGRAVMERLEPRRHFSADLSAEDRDLQELIIRHEGMVLYVYPDSMGNPTVGVGFNLNSPGAREKLREAGLDYERVMRTWEMTRTRWLRSGRGLAQLRTDNAHNRLWRQFVHSAPPEQAIDEQQSRKLLAVTLGEAIADSRRLVRGFDQLDHGPQTAVVDMVFNLGAGGFSKFRRVIGDLDRRDLGSAARNMKDSRWARQTGRRAAEDAGRMREQPGEGRKGKW